MSALLEVAVVIVCEEASDIQNVGTKQNIAIIFTPLEVLKTQQYVLNSARYRVARIKTPG